MGVEEPCGVGVALSARRVSSAFAVTVAIVQMACSWLLDGSGGQPSDVPRGVAQDGKRGRSLAAVQVVSQRQTSERTTIRFMAARKGESGLIQVSIPSM